MPLPGSKREKAMLEQLKPAPAPKTTRTRKSSFLQEIVEPENMVPQEVEEKTEEE